MAPFAVTRPAPFHDQTGIYGMINMPFIVPEIVTAIALLIFFVAIKTATGYTGSAI